MTDLASLFHVHRPRLFGVAYRMLGSRADAEDVLQDAWLRWHTADASSIESHEAWLVTVVTRLCLDRLRERKHATEQYVGPWLPEPILTDTLPSPELQLELQNEVSVAFLAVLERLGPEKRAAFLLKEVFDYDYSEIAQMLGKGEAALRQMVHRAREEVRAARPKFTVAEAVRERLLEKFMAAAATGDRAAIMALLSEDVEYISDGGGKVYAALKVLHGAERIGRLYYSIARSWPGIQYRLIRINGELGAVNLFEGRLHSVLSFRIDGDRITGIYVMRNPDKLAGIALGKL
ncbi:MAG: RNA polymerase sigma-70 factor [Burkholderiales bacterium]|nr:RNA polymerase sigma-70 factor [Burkholderiales bacterium]